MNPVLDKLSGGIPLTGLLMLKHLDIPFKSNDEAAVLAKFKNLKELIIRCFVPSKHIILAISFAHVTYFCFPSF